MTASDWLRPADARRRYGISERTLARWAAGGLISKSQPAGMRIVEYRAADIDDVLAAGATARKVVPLAAPLPAPMTDELDDFWTEARR